MNTENTRLVLVVDDNPLNRNIIGDFLMFKGYEVDEAANGIEAIKKISEKNYHLIIMDLLMPGLNGYEATKRIRQLGITTPIIAQSSLSMKQDRDRCFQAGFDDFIPKPLDLHLLLAKIEKLGNKVSSALIKENGQGEKMLNLASPLSLLSGKKALLVEEDGETSARYMNILRDLEVDVRPLFSGSQALEVLDESGHGIEIIIMNVFTSGIDALGLTTIVKRKFPEIMIFVYIPEYHLDTIQTALKLGADGVVIQVAFESTIANTIESAIYQKLINDHPADKEDIKRQIHSSQAQLYHYGMMNDVSCIDVASSTLCEAGGDLVLVKRFNLAGRYGVVLADVSGHDVSSSYISAIFLGIISSLWDTLQSPDDLIRAINGELLKLKTTNYHVCITALLWEQRRGIVRIASAGNPGGLQAIRNEDNSLSLTSLAGGGMCLGLLERDDLFTSQTISFGKDQFLILYSDGFEDEKLVHVLSESSLLSNTPIKGVSKIILDRFLSSNEQTDDMVLMILEGQKNIPDTGYHYSFNSNYEDVNVAIEWLSTIITKNDLPKEKDYDFVMLAIRETLLNAVEHGNKDKPLAYIDVSVYKNPGILRIDVSDEGKGFDFRKEHEKTANQDSLGIGRRGLPLINSVADKIEVNGGTISLLFQNT